MQNSHSESRVIFYYSELIMLLNFLLFNARTEGVLQNRRYTSPKSIIIDFSILMTLMILEGESNYFLLVWKAGDGSRMIIFGHI